MLLALFALAALPAPARPSVTLHYRLDITASRQFERERSSTDTAVLDGDFTVAAFVSTTLRDTTNGQVGHVVIDSVTCSGTGILSMAYDAAVGRASRGVWYDVLLIRGSPDEVPAPSARNPLTDAVGQFAAALFAPEHASHQMGETWSDTLNLRIVTDNYTQSGPTVTRWKVVAAAQDSTLLRGDITGVASITGRVVATGIVLGRRTLTLSPDGAVLRASLMTTQQYLLANQGAEQARPGHGSTDAEIRLLR